MNDLRCIGGVLLLLMPCDAWLVHDHADIFVVDPTKPTPNKKGAKRARGFAGGMGDGPPGEDCQ